MTDDLGGDPACWSHLLHDDQDGNGLIAVDLNEVDTDGASGAVWSLPDGGDLNANVVHLGRAATIGAHVNSEVDVIVSVVAGTGRLTVDGSECPLRVGVFALVPKGTEREIRAGPDGVTYLRMHRRRSPLSIRPRNRE